MEKKAKRPPNAYILYCNAVREEVKKENPDLSNQEIIKIISQKYKNEDKAVLQKYVELAKEKQAEFKAENPNYKYKKTSPKKKEAEQKLDPLEALNKTFANNPFTLQCMSQ